MEPNIRNFSEIERFIRDNPKQADAQAFEWERFFKATSPDSPELYSIETAEEFYEWARQHPEKNIDTSVWVGKEIADSYYYLREQDEEDQMKKNGFVDRSQAPRSLLGTVSLATMFLDRPKTMDEDSSFIKIKEGLKKEWIKNNPGKSLDSQEGLDYIYGSSNDNIFSSPLRQQAEKIFRDNPKFQKRIEKYDKDKNKIYKRQNDDPTLYYKYEKNKQDELYDRINLLRKSMGKDSKISDKGIEDYQERLRIRLDAKYKNDFTINYSEKAKKYAEDAAKEEAEKQLKQYLKEARSKASPAQTPSQGNFSEQPGNQPKNFLKNRFPNPFKRGVPKVGSQAGSTAIKQAGKMLAQTAAKAILSNPYVLAAIGIIVAIIIIVFVIVYYTGKNKYSNQQSMFIPPKTITASYSPC